MELACAVAEADAKPLTISPLRYPGAKGKLAPYVAEALRLSRLRPKLFVEPFAGGASVSLHVLQAGLAEKIGLGERSAFGELLGDGLQRPRVASRTDQANTGHARDLEKASQPGY